MARAAHSDLGVACEGAEYDGLRALAGGLIALWPVGVPLGCWWLLRASRDAPAASLLAQSVSFLHDEYKPEYRSWELVELARRLLLTGYVFLVPQAHTLLRLVLAILVSLGHVVLLMYAAPYRQASTAFSAVAASVLLQCTLIVAMLVQVYDTLPYELIKDYFGFESVLPLAAIIFSFTVVVLAVTLMLCLYQLRVEAQQVATLRIKATGQPPTLTLATDKQWHLFLSHNWANQDVVATIKRQLQLLLPGVQVFLEWARRRWNRVR